MFEKFYKHVILSNSSSLFGKSKGVFLTQCKSIKISSRFKSGVLSFDISLFCALVTKRGSSEKEYCFETKVYLLFLVRMTHPSRKVPGDSENCGMISESKELNSSVCKYLKSVKKIVACHTKVAGKTAVIRLEIISSSSNW